MGRESSTSIAHKVWVCVCRVPHVRIDTRDVAFVMRGSYTCGETRVDIFVSAAALYVWEQTMLDDTTLIHFYILKPSPITSSPYLIRMVPHLIVPYLFMKNESNTQIPWNRFS